MKLILENWRRYLNEIQTDMDELVQSPGYEAEDVNQFFITLSIPLAAGQILDDLINGFVKKYKHGTPGAQRGGSTSSDIVGYSGDSSNIELFHGGDHYTTTVVMPAKPFTKTNCDKGGCKPIQLEYKNVDFLVQDNFAPLYRVLEFSGREEATKGPPGSHAFLNVFLGIGTQAQKAVYNALDVLGGEQPSLVLDNSHGNDEEASAAQIKDGLAITINSAMSGFANAFKGLEENTFEGVAQVVVPVMQTAILKAIEEESSAPWFHAKSAEAKKLDLKYKEFFGVGKGNEKWRDFGKEFLKEFLKQRILAIGRDYKKEKEWVVDSDILYIPKGSEVYISGWSRSTYIDIVNMIEALARGNTRGKTTAAAKRLLRRDLGHMINKKDEVGKIVKKLAGSPENYKIYVTQPTFSPAPRTEVKWDWPFNENTAMPYEQYAENIKEIDDVLQKWLPRAGAYGFPQAWDEKAAAKRLLALLGGSLEGVA